MLENWQVYLAEQGATIENGCVLSFNTQEKEIEYSNSASIVCDLSHYTLIKVTGADANSFLQGQLSNDINHVSNTQSQMSSYCSPKGRALALFRVFQIDTAYYLSLPSEIASKTLQRLKMFVMRSDVTMDDVTEQYFHFGVAGKQAADNIKTALGLTALPDKQDDAIAEKQLSVQKLPQTSDKSTDRFELFGAYTDATTNWEQLKTVCQPVGQSAWNLLRINAGIPEITTNIAEAFVPQMLNLQLVNAVNFQKGCYPGQEIVARTKYLGKLKKRLYLAEIATQNPIIIGTDLYESGSNQQSIGKIVSAALSAVDTYRILLVLRISAVENQPICLADKAGSAIKILELPYSIEE